MSRLKQLRVTKFYGRAVDALLASISKNNIFFFFFFFLGGGGGGGVKYFKYCNLVLSVPSFGFLA